MKVLRCIGAILLLIWVEAIAWNGGDDYRLTVIESK